MPVVGGMPAMEIIFKQTDRQTHTHNHSAMIITLEYFPKPGNYHI